jgi:hypothetical protein
LAGVAFHRVGEQSLIGFGGLAEFVGEDQRQVDGAGAVGAGRFRLNYQVGAGVGVDAQNELVFVLGDNSFAGAGGSGGPVEPTLVGDNDIAAVFGAGSDAYAGADNFFIGNLDLATAFGDGLNPDATGANYLVDIMPMVSGLDSALSTLLTDIASLF